MQRISDVAPTLVQRQCGGWLALSSRGDALKIGVTDESEEGARTKYGTARAGWVAMLEGEAVGEGVSPPRNAGLSQVS